MDYVFTDDMYSISGHGGKHEAACRFVLSEGLKYYKGNVTETNDPKIAVEFAVVMARIARQSVAKFGVRITNEDAGQIVRHMKYISQNGWSKYVERSRHNARLDINPLSGDFFSA